jgi:hypothetical protein
VALTDSDLMIVTVQDRFTATNAGLVMATHWFAK